jgi:superfamily II DNA/RNA helicase
VHRAGRTARGAARGIVSTIATWQDLPMVRQIETILGEKIARCSVAGVEMWEETEKKPNRSRSRV